MISPLSALRSRRVASLSGTPGSPGSYRLAERLNPRYLRAYREAAKRIGWRHGLWLALWAPWWVGNEMAPPAAPGTRDVDVMQPVEGSAGDWILEELDDLRFRFGLSWTAALMLRGAWLGGIVNIAWLLLSAATSVPNPTIPQLVIAVVAGIVLGMVLRVFQRPSYQSVAVLLERSFGLRSRLTTGVLGLRLNDPSGSKLDALQLADAANALSQSRKHLTPNHWVPIREIFIFFTVALTLLLILVAQRPEGSISAIASPGIPRFVPVSERLAAAEQQQEIPEVMPDAATLEEVEDISRTSNQARIDLETIGEALEGNAGTSPAASSIESGNYPEANRQLNDASESVSQLPENQREALADDLDEAAERVSGDNPDLAAAARDASDDIRSGEDRGALDELGEQIEDTGSAVVSQESRNGDLSSSQSDPQGGSESNSSAGGQSSEQQEAPGDSGAGEAPGSQGGDPGAGMEASGGVGSSGDDGQPSDNGGSGEQGAAASNTSGEDSAADGSPGENASSAGEEGSGDASGGGTSDSGQIAGGPDEEDGEAQGSGAGSGQSDANDQTESADATNGGGDLDNDDQAPDAGDGEAGDPPPGGDGADDGSGDDTVAGGGRSSITLPGTSDDRVSSGSDIGSSSVGSGGGVGAGSGNSGGSASGSTGPDPNDVPTQWRTVVEEYFRDGGAP